MELKLGELVEAGAGLLAIVGSGVIVFRAYLSKYRNLNNSDTISGTATAAISAEHSSMEVLYTCITAEVKRLTQTNAELSKEVENLRANLAELHAENTALLTQVQTMREQLIRLEALFLDCTTCPSNRRRAEATGETGNCRTINDALSKGRRAGEAARIVSLNHSD